MAQITCSGADASLTTDDFIRCVDSEANNDLHIDFNLCMAEIVKQKNVCDWLRASSDLSIFYKGFIAGSHLGGRDHVVAQEMHNFFAKFSSASSAVAQVGAEVERNVKPEDVLNAKLYEATNPLLGGSENKIFGFIGAPPTLLTKEEIDTRIAVIAEKALTLQGGMTAAQTLQRGIDCVNNNKVRECLNLPEIITTDSDYSCHNHDQIQYDITTMVNGHNLTIISDSFLQIVDFYCLLGTKMGDSLNYTKTLEHITIKASGFSLNNVKFSSALKSLSLEQDQFSSDSNMIKGVTVPNLSFNGATVVIAGFNNFTQSLNLFLRNSQDLCSIYLTATGVVISPSVSITNASSCITIASTGTFNVGQLSVSLDPTGTGDNAFVLERNAKIIADRFRISGNNNKPVFANSGIVTANIETASEVTILNSGQLFSASARINSEVFVNLAGGVFYNDETVHFATDYVYNLGNITIGEFALRGNGVDEQSKLFYNNGAIRVISSNVNVRALINRGNIIFTARSQIECGIIENMSGNLVFLSNNILLKTPRIVIEPTYFSYSHSKNIGSTDFKFSMVILRESVDAVFDIGQIEVLGSILKSEAHLSFTNCPTIILKSFGAAGLIVNGAVLPNNINAVLYVKNANVVCSKLITSIDMPGAVKTMLAISDNAYRQLVPTKIDTISTEILRGMSSPQLLAIIAAKPQFAIKRNVVGMTIDTSIFTDQVFLQGGFNFRFDMLSSISHDKVKFIEIFEANAHLAKHDELVVQFKNDNPTKLSDTSFYQSTPKGIKEFLGSIGYVSGDPIFTTGAFFEKCLIEKTLLTGLAMPKLESSVSVTTQMSSLFRNAQSVYKALGLEVGKEISGDLITKLGASLIWPVFKNITMPNGKIERILVPVLYLNQRELLLASSDPLLSIEQSNFTIVGSVINYHQLNFHDAFVRINGDFLNAGRVVGSGEFKVNNFLQLGEIANLDAFKIFADNFVAPSVTKTMHTGNGYYAAKVETGSKFRMLGAFELNVTDTLLLQDVDADFKNKTRLAARNVVFVPLQLIGESWESYSKKIRKCGVKVGKKTTTVHNLAITHEFGHINTESDLKIDASEQIQWVGIDVTGKGDITAEALVGLAIATINDVHLRDQNVRKDYYLGRVFDRRHHHLDQSSTPLPMIIKTEHGTVKLYSGHKDADSNGKAIESGSVVIQGVKIQATQVHIRVEDNGIIALTPAKAAKFTLDEIQKSVFFTSSDAGYVIAGYKQSTHAHLREELYPSVIQVEELFYVQAGNGTYIQIASHVVSDGRIVLDAETIYVAASPAMEAQIDAEQIVSFGLSATFSLNEISVGAGWRGIFTKEATTQYKNLRPMLHAKSGIEIACHNNGTVTYVGADLATNGTYISKCHKANLEPAADTTEYSASTTTFTLMTKIGAKSKIGALVDGAQRLSSGVAQGGEDGAINAAFGLLNSYNALLSMQSGIITLGAWCEATFITQRFSQQQSTPVPTTLVAQVFASLDDELRIIGAHIEAGSAIFRNHKLNIEAATARYSQKSSSFAADVTVPLTGGAPSGGAQYSQANAEAVTYFNAIIKVHRQLSVEISGHTKISGAEITARSIQALFDTLIVESLQDTYHLRSNGIGLRSDSIGGSYGNRDRAKVGEQTRIIATGDGAEDELNIVVARSLVLAGAMIANAKRDQNGHLTDLGKLTLTAGELFIQHIKDYDHGKTLGASVKILRDDEKSKDIGTFQYASIDGQGEVLATIGNGTLEVGTQSGDTLNRNINDAQSWTQEEYNVDIKIQQTPSLDEIKSPEELLANIFNGVKSDIKGVAGIVTTAFETVGDWLGLRETGQQAVNLCDEDKKKLENFYDESVDILLRDNDDDTTTTQTPASTITSTSTTTQNNEDKTRDTDNKGASNNENIKAPGFAEGKLSLGAEKIKSLSLKYAEFAKENPTLAKYGASIVAIALNAIAGAIAGGIAGSTAGGVGTVPGAMAGGTVGLVSGAVREGKSWIFGEVAGDTITFAISSLAKMSAPQLMRLDSTLDQKGAELLIKAAVLAVSSGKDIADSMKILAKSLKPRHAFADGIDPDGYYGKKTGDSPDDNTLFCKEYPETVQKVGGRYPINADKAGKIYHFDDLPDSVKTKYPHLKDQYPHGIKYDELGFPNFSPYAIRTVKIERFVSRDADFKDADIMAKGLDPNFIRPKDYTWHHHQDKQTMQLVPMDLHDAFKHTGGMSTTKHGGK